MGALANLRQCACLCSWVCLLVRVSVLAFNRERARWCECQCVCTHTPLWSFHVIHIDSDAQWWRVQSSGLRHLEMMSKCVRICLSTTHSRSYVYTVVLTSFATNASVFFSIAVWACTAVGFVSFGNPVNTLAISDHEALKSGLANVMLTGSDAEKVGIPLSVCVCALDHVALKSGLQISS